MAEDGTPEEADEQESLLTRMLRRGIITLVSLLLGTAVTGAKTADALADRNSSPEATYALQAACTAAGYSTDAAGVCYDRDPRGLSPAELAAAVVPPPPPVPTGADGVVAGGPQDPDGGPAIQIVPPAPDGTAAGDAATAPGKPGSGNAGTSGGTADPNAPADPGAPANPNAPASPDAPANPNAPGAQPGRPGASAQRPAETSDDEPAPVVVRTPIRLTLPLNFSPDPKPTVMETTGGIVDVGAALENCVGWAGGDPDIVLEYTQADGSVAGSSGLPLRVFFESSPAGTDTGLVINDPYGRWWCNDNWKQGAIDPMITFLDAGYGTYDIWVGALARGTGPPGTVYITERPLTPAS